MQQSPRELVLSLWERFSQTFSLMTTSSRRSTRHGRCCLVTDWLHFIQAKNSITTALTKTMGPCRLELQGDSYCPQELAIRKTPRNFKLKPWHKAWLIKICIFMKIELFFFWHCLQLFYHWLRKNLRPDNCWLYRFFSAETLNWSKQLKTSHCNRQTNWRKLVKSYFTVDTRKTILKPPKGCRSLKMTGKKDPVFTKKKNMKNICRLKQFILFPSRLKHLTPVLFRPKNSGDRI